MSTVINIYENQIYRDFICVCNNRCVCYNKSLTCRLHSSAYRPSIILSNSLCVPNSYHGFRFIQLTKSPNYFSPQLYHYLKHKFDPNQQWLIIDVQLLNLFFLLSSPVPKEPSMSSRSSIRFMSPYSPIVP